MDKSFAGYRSPLVVIAGRGCERRVLAHIYYLAVKRKLKTRVVCFAAKPLRHLLGLLALSSGIPKRDLYSFRVSPYFFGAFNEGCGELYDAQLIFYDGMDADHFYEFVLGLKSAETEALIVDALDAATLRSGEASDLERKGSILSILRSVAEKDTMTIVAGCRDDHWLAGSEWDFVRYPSRS